jgi:hypothetical protein
MKTSTVVIVGIIAVGVLGLLAWVAFDHSAPGAFIAGLAGLVGGFKAKLFGKSAGEIREEHRAKRETWAVEAAEYEEKLSALEARMEYLDYRSAKLAMLLKDLDAEEAGKLKEIASKTPDEILALLNRP